MQPDGETRQLCILGITSFYHSPALFSAAFTSSSSSACVFFRFLYADDALERVRSVPGYECDLGCRVLPLEPGFRTASAYTSWGIYILPVGVIMMTAGGGGCKALATAADGCRGGGLLVMLTTLEALTLAAAAARLRPSPR